jgi:hypothetical protein
MQSKPALPSRSFRAVRHERRIRDDLEFWRGCVVPGTFHLDIVTIDRLPPQPFEHLINVCDESGRGFVSGIASSPLVEAAVAEVGRALGLDRGDENFVGDLARRSAEILTSACAAGDGAHATAVRRCCVERFRR